MWVPYPAPADQNQYQELRMLGNRNDAIPSVLPVLIRRVAAAADKRLLKKAPRERGDAESCEQGEDAYGELAKIVELRLGVKEDSVGKKVEGVVEQVDAVRDATEPSEKAPAHDGREPSPRLRDYGQQESAVEKGEPSVADGDGDRVNGMDQPPEQPAHAQK